MKTCADGPETVWENRVKSFNSCVKSAFKNQKREIVEYVLFDFGREKFHPDFRSVLCIFQLRTGKRWNSLVSTGQTNATARGKKKKKSKKQKNNEIKQNIMNKKRAPRTNVLWRRICVVVRYYLLLLHTPVGYVRALRRRYNRNN